MIVSSRMVGIYTLIFCFAGFCTAATAKDLPSRILEADTILGSLPLAQVLDNGKNLLPGDFGIKAKIQLAFGDQQYVVDRQSVEIINAKEGRSFALAAPRIPIKPQATLLPQLTESHDLTSNILNADELWLTYRAATGSNRCGIYADIDTHALPYKKAGQTTTPTAKPLKLYSQNRQYRSVDIALDDVKVLPRDIPYLIKSRSGMNFDPDWRFIKESNRHVFMRLLRVDLHGIDSVDLEMGKTVERVNFRISRKDTGKPTDMLDWDTIPKDVVMHGGKRWMRLNMAKALRQQLPEALEANIPLTLVEIIAFVQTGTGSSTALDAPINDLRVNYSVPETAVSLGDIELPAQIERVGPDSWRWRLSLAALHDTKSDEIEFLHGRIVPDKEGCIAAFERVEFVSLAKRDMPAVLANIQESARNWGGPFGLVNEDSNEIELPKFLAHLSFAQPSKDLTKPLILPPGGRYILRDRGISVTSRDTSPLTMSLGSDGLQLKGGGEVALSWPAAISLPAHAYLALRSVASVNTMQRARIRLRFADGYTETLAYTLGEAISLHKFTGRRLVGADVFFRLPKIDGALSVAEIALFTLKVVKTEQALKETLIADRILNTYKVKLGSMELTPKLPAEEFWRDLVKGQAWLDYGNVHWSGGDALPVLAHLNPMLGKVIEWRFVYPGSTDAQLQAWLAEPPPNTTPAVSSSARWLKLGSFILLAASAVVLWRRGRIQQVAASFGSSLLQLMHHLSNSVQFIAQALWTFSVTHRQVLNLLALLAAVGLAMCCYTFCTNRPLMDKLPYALLVLSLFFGLNIWRWRLEEDKTKPREFLQRWLASNGVWPSRIIWIVAVLSIVLILQGMVSQLLIAAGVVDFAKLVTDMGLVGTIALLAMGILMDTRSLVGWVPLLLAVIYGLMPWLGAWTYWMTTPAARVARWLVLVLAFYVVGLAHIGHAGENYYFTFGGIVVVVTWRIWMGRIRSKFEQRWPAVAAKVYGGAGSVYFSGALVGLAITALLLIPHLELLAEQVAIIVYYCLVAGTVLEIVALRRAHREQSDSTKLNLQAAIADATLEPTK